MRQLKLFVPAFLLALAPLCVHAQGQGSGILYASDFAAWSLPQGNTPTAGMIQWPSAAICQISSNGYTFTAVKIGRPLTIVDVVPSQSETVIPTAVTTSGGSCTVTAPMVNVHTSYSVRSGTAGLQEAIDYSAKTVGGSVVVLTPGWSVAGGTSSMITAAYGQSITSILDERVATLCQYAWTGSAYAASGCSTSGASLSTLTLQTFAGPLAVPQGITAPITGHASLDLPLTGGILSGALVGPQINGTFTPATSANLSSIIAGAGAGSDILLQCGTYASTGMAMPSANVHLHGVSRDCTFINFTTSAGLDVTGANVEIDGITFEGATNNYTVQVETTAHSFNFHNNRITGAGSALGASQNSAALAVIAPNQDTWVTDSEFTGNGVTGNTGYIVKTDGAAAGYVQRFHFNRNWIHDNTSPDPLYTFDIANSDITDNVIDQGNICGGVLCNNPAGNGVGYSISVYSEGYAITINTLTRVAGTVTAVLPTAFAPSWPLQVGDQILEELALLGTNGTDFNGVFTVTSISVDRKTITWSQTGIPDDTGAGFGPPYANGLIIPPLQNVRVSRNTITNSAGACIYFQGMSNLVTTDNTLTQCDLQSQAGGHPQSAIGLNGVWGGTVTGNAIDGVGLTHGIAAQNAYFVTIAGNTIGNIPVGMGINIYDSAHLAVNANTVHDAQTGIGTSAGTTPNCFHCSFTGNTIRMKSNGSGYGLSAADSQISITGGSVHAPSTGLSNSAIGLGALTSQVTVSGVTINCQPDGATAATATTFYGIRNTAGAVANTIRGNTVTGCNVTNGAGVFDEGDDAILADNKVSAGAYGILADAGNRQLISGNILWGNVVPLRTVGSTGSVSQGNQTTQGATPVWYAFDFTLPTYTFGTNTTVVPEVLSLNSAAAHQRSFSFLTAGVARWGLTAESDAESGANAGTSFSLRAFDDAGTTIDVPISIVRAAGGVETHTRPVVMPSLKVTGAAGASTFCLQIDNAGNISNTGSGCGAGGAGVATINGTAGAFTFTGAGVSCTTTTCTFSGTGSGVTSVGMTVPAWLTVAGSPVTTSGTLAVTGTSEAANLFLASPNGSSGAMTPRAIVAADVPTLNQNTSGTAAGLTGNPNASVTNLTILGTCTGCPGVGGAITATSVTVSGFIATNAEFSLGTCTTAKTIDPANGNRQKVTLTDANTCALTFTQPASGTATVQIKVTQSAAGAFSGGVSGCKWPGGAVPTITQTSGAIDMISAYLDGTTAYCQIAQAFN